MAEVESLLDRSIAPEGYLIQIPPDSYDMNQVDLSQIDFEQLSEQFNTEHKRVEAERLRGAINAKLTAMIRLNRSRMDYQRFLLRRREKHLYRERIDVSKERIAENVVEILEDEV